MLIVYFAARYSRNAELREYRDVIERYGYRVTSRWIDLHLDDAGVPQVESSFTPEVLAASPGYTGLFARRDLEDLDAANTVISFTEGERDTGSKGGRHVEFGYAVATNKQLIVIGPREHVFHTLPQVKHFDSWNEFLTVFATSYFTITTDPAQI